MLQYTAKVTVDRVTNMCVVHSNILWLLIHSV